MTQLVFLGAMGRSGTNLLHNALDCHPDIASGPEFNFLEDIIQIHRTLNRGLDHGRISAYTTKDGIDKSVGSLIRELLAPYAQRRGRKILVEKTPSNIWCFEELSKIFPDAKFIHLIRDGRDVCVSHREVGKRMMAKGEAPDPNRDSAVTSIFHCAALWAETVRYGLRIAGPDSPLFKAGRIITLRYEELVTDPERQLRRVCSHLGVNFVPEMLHPEKITHDTFIDDIWVKEEDQTRPISPFAVGSWKKKLSLRERVLFAAKGQEGLFISGYEQDSQWSVNGLSLSPEEAKAEIAKARNEIELISLPDTMAQAASSRTPTPKSSKTTRESV